AVEHVVERGAVRHRQREAMQPARELVVLARDGEQLAQLPAQRLVLLAQHPHLALDQRHRAPGLVAQRELRQDAGPALEEIGVIFEVAGDRLLPRKLVRLAFRFVAGCLLRHDPSSSMLPWYTVRAGPVSQTGSPSPAHATVTAPPGSSTSTVSASRSCSRPAITAAQAPLPQPSVSPAP